MSTSPRGKREVPSDDLVALLKHQKQIKEWQDAVSKRILSMEDTYLRDTPMGNIVRGFDTDGVGGTRGGGRHKEGTTIDDKERLFSSSSQAVYLERQERKLAS